MPNHNELMIELMLRMETEMGRLPTEDEVYRFINGTNDERVEILRNGQGGSAFGDETEKYGLDDCAWWDVPTLVRPFWAQMDCGGRVDEEDTGLLCENHYNAFKGLPI